MADEDMDLLVCQRCLQNLKLAKTFSDAMEVATIMMNLKKSTTNTDPAFVGFVTDVATRAIERAETLKKAQTTKKHRDLTEEEKHAQRAAVAKAYQAKHGVLSGGKVAKPAPGAALVRVSTAERQRQARGGEVGSGGGRLSAYARKRRSGAAAAADPRRDYYGSLTQQANMAKQISAKCRENRRIDGTIPQFEDTLFPADSKSLFPERSADLGAAKPKGAAIVAWKRPKELAKKWGAKACLFMDGADPGDVEQGALGDCWLLGAFSIVAANGADKLRRLVVHSDFDAGVHAFTFYRNREWTKVVIDDRLPVSATDNLVFGHCKNPGEFWVPLMEKAYAKLNGSYGSIEAGIEGDALVDMTGGASKILAFDPDHTSVQRTQVWQLLLQHQNRGSMMGCASNGQNSMVAREAVRLGLVLNHAYGILQVCEIQRQDGQKVKLLKLRNPWGEKEWQGRWACRDRSRWDSISPQLREQLGYVDQNDGTFFMDFE